LRHPREVLALAISPDGKAALTGCADGKIRVWDLESGQIRLEFEGQQGAVKAVAFVPRRSAFVSGGATGSVAVWELDSGRRLGNLVGHTQAVNTVATSPDGMVALTGSDDRTAWFWNLADMSCRSVLPHSHPVHTVGFSPDKRSFVTGSGIANSGPGEWRLYTIPSLDSKEQAPIRTFTTESKKAVRSAVFSPGSGQTLLIGDDDWSASFWDVADRELMAIEEYTQGSVCGVAFSPDGRTAVTAAYDSSEVYLWDVEEARAAWEPNRRSPIPWKLSRKNLPGPLNPVLRHPEYVTAVAYSPTNNRLFLTACNDGYVRCGRRRLDPR
jgi:WD40 repeat protein